MPASSSSSEDEDLSIFASCAVSADQLGKDASLQASKRAKASARRSSAAAAVASRPAVQQEGHGILKQQEEPVNDLIGAKV
jgi:hypothetical protein